MTRDFALIGQVVDVIQTLALLAVAIAVIYVVVRLERALALSMVTLTEVLERARSNAARLDAIEQRQLDDDAR